MDALVVHPPLKFRLSSDELMSALVGDVDTQISVAWGIIVGLLASFVQSLGLTIQRKSHILNQSLPQGDQRVEHRRPLWLLGFAIFISSNILGSLFQIASLPVVILAPLGAVSLLWNAFFARLLLGDTFSPWMILGTVFIAGGAVLIAVFGIVPEATHSLDDLLRLFGRATFVIYFSLLGLVVVIWLIITHLTEFSLTRRVHMHLSPPMSPAPLSPTTASFHIPLHSSERSPSERTPLIDRKAPAPLRPPTPLSYNDPAIERTRIMVAISYASISGILSGMCLIFAKSGVELLMLTLGGKNQFYRWQAWFLLLGLAVFALLQLWYLHKGLVFADPTIVCPLAFCFYNISSIVNGLVYFDQFSFLSPLYISLVSLGMVVLLGGVWIVSSFAGVGGVDVGTWQEGDAVLDEESVSDSGLTPPESLYTPEQVSPRRLESSVSVTESAPIDSGAFSPPAHTAAFPTSPDTANHENHDRLSLSLTLSPTSPGGRSRRKRARFPSLLSPSESSSATLGVPAGGFSIGLSPASPGFAIVPRGRVGGFRRIVQHATMRRTVSESDAAIGARIPSEGDGVFDVPSPVPEEVDRPDRVKAKVRWRWLKSVFRDRNS